MTFAALPHTGRVGCQDHNALLSAIRHEGFDFGMKVMPHTRTVMTLFLGMEGKQPECRVAPVIEEQVIRPGIQQILSGQFTLTRCIGHHVRLQDLIIQYIE